MTDTRMRRLVPFLPPFLALMLCVASAPLQAQQPKIDPSKFVVFIHAGPYLKDGDVAVRQIAGALFSKGYVVRSPDNDVDEIAGPGVDYFDDNARDAAQDVADTVNELLPRFNRTGFQGKKLIPRRQKTKTPPNYLGVWLFAAPT
jgi:hypothetical protein